MPRLLALIVAGLLLHSGSAGAQPADPAEVVAAERAFAADGLALGVDRAFLKWSAAEAVMIVDGAVQSVPSLFDPNAAPDVQAPALVWWPNWAGIAKSGDLGFTTGGVEVGGRRTGHYFTIWKRQANGEWRWVYDGGVAASAAQVPGPDTEPAILPTSILESPSPDAAMSEVRTVEAVLAAAAVRDQKAAHLSLLAPDGRLYVAPLPPAVGADRFSEALDAWPQRMDLSPPLGGGSSESGDLVWTYGRAVWVDAPTAGSGYYVHLWQKRSTGWVLVFAQMLTDPPAPSPAAH